MRILISFLFTIIWLNGFSQNLEGTAWKIDKIIGKDLTNAAEFSLQKADTTKKFWDNGNTVRFFADGSFKCAYKAKCGKDCFPSSMGKYNITDTNTVTIFVEEFHQKGHCETIHKSINKTLGTYNMVRKNDEAILLIKRTEP